MSDGRAIVVHVGGERYAVPTAAVEEIVDRPRLSPLPRLAPHLAGLLRFRDAWIPAIDATPLIGATGTGGSGGAGVALIIRCGTRRIALLADAVIGLAEVTGGAAEDDLVAVDPDGPLGVLHPDTLFRAGGDDAPVPDEAPAAPPVTTTFVTVRAGRFIAAVDVERVGEVLHAPKLQAVADAPGFIAGAVRWRERRLPCFDLAARLGSVAEPGEAAAVLVLRSAGIAVGARVDEALGVARLGPGALRPLPALLARCAPPALRALAYADARVLAILDPDALLAPAEWGELAGHEAARRPESASSR